MCKFLADMTKGFTHSLIIVSCLCLLAGIMPVSSFAATSGKPGAVETLATVIVNGVPLEEADLSREINRLAPVAEYHNLSKERWEVIRKQAIDNLVDKELFYREALYRGITWDEEWVEFTYEKNRKKYSKDEHTRAIFENEDMKNRLLDDLRQTYVISKLWQEGKKQSTPTDKEVETYFQNNRDKFRSPKAFKVIELMIEMKPSASKLEWEKASKRINTLYKKAAKNRDFSLLSKGQSDIKISEKIVHVGLQNYDIKKLEKLADGDISKPMFTINGYMIIKRLKLIPSVEFKFAEVREQVKNELLNVRYKKWFESLRQELRDKAKIIIGAGPAYVGR